MKELKMNIGNCDEIVGLHATISRHGIAGTKDNVLSRAAFEITIATIAGAARIDEIEELRRIIENVIVGSQSTLEVVCSSIHEVAKKRGSD